MSHPITAKIQAKQLNTMNTKATALLVVAYLLRKFNTCRWSGYVLMFVGKSVYSTSEKGRSRRGRNRSANELQLEQMTTSYQAQILKAYMTWLSIISSNPETGDRNTGGQGSPPHGDRYPFIPSLHAALKKIRKQSIVISNYKHQGERRLKCTP